VSLDIRVKHALLRIGTVAVASGISAMVLFGVGRLIFVGNLGFALPSTSESNPPASAPPSPTPSPPVPTDVTTPTPSPTTTATPEPSPTETAAPTPPPLALASFRFDGRSYVGILVPDVGRTFVAPFAGTVEIRNYQFINGEVRVGSNVATLPFFPYISVITSDRKITYRPGVLGAVTELLAQDGNSIAAGDPLFRLIAPGRSSWATFYNSSAPYEVVVSLQGVPSGRDLDATPYLS
jgi:hypothetical protein